jgi:hypothetical protein
MKLIVILIFSSLFGSSYCLRKKRAGNNGIVAPGT